MPRVVANSKRWCSQMVFSDEWKNKAHGAKPGSIVTIIRVSHGDENGIYIGGKPLSLSGLAGACAKFQTNAQINLIIKACSSEESSRYLTRKNGKARFWPS